MDDLLKRDPDFSKNAFQPDMITPVGIRRDTPRKVTLVLLSPLVVFGLGRVEYKRIGFVFSLLSGLFAILKHMY
jgi:hypothetical protein